MRIPLTKYGLPQVITYPLSILIVMGGIWLFFEGCFADAVLWSIEITLFLVLIWQISFFRDPKRKLPDGENYFISPADGKITDVEVVEETEFINGKALRIGIFLSIFNVHINRAPANVKVEKIVYKPGKFKDARSPECGRVNESNDLYLTMTDGPRCKLIVRQISGAIARRIVCKASEGKDLSIGEKFGMIKFGSRTELFIPAEVDIEVLVKPGNTVKAGLTKVANFH